MSVAELLQKRKAELAAKNLSDGIAFLADNAKQPDVVTLPSGLQYKIIKQGTGETPVLTDTVLCHYEGKNLKGEVFDSSIQRGTPATFKIAKLIQGYQQALPLMPLGSTWILYVPSELAYKDEHKSKEIGANSTLIFEVQLLDIVK
jgi:FKBP-type peptidyl-prolyl cis-trans isomerase FklB